MSRAIRVPLLALCMAFALPVAGARADEADDVIVVQLVAERAASLAALSRRFEVREQELLSRIAARARQASRSLRRADLAAAERARLEDESIAIARECDELTARLSASFPDFAADLAAYRAAVTSLAHSLDPRRVAALERYAAGDRVGALVVLTELQEAETRAVAAGWREIGALALDMRDRGERTTGQVTVVFAQAHRLDPTDSAATRQLVLLYLEEHLYAEAQSALQAHQRTPLAPEERGSALLLQAELEQEFGEHRRARTTLREAMSIYAQLQGADPSNPAHLLQRLIVSHRFILAFRETGNLSDAEREALNADRRAVQQWMADAAAGAPAFAEMEAGQVFEVLQVACSLSGRHELSVEQRARLAEQCRTGVAHLQAAAPGSYFASRAQLVGAILTLNTSSNPALTVVTEMPQLIALVRELSARDPDSILLLNVLGNYLLLYETLSRAQAPSGGAPVQARSVGDMREAIATFEALADRGRLSPSELLTLANFYGVAHQVGVTPDAGAPPYLERRDRLVEQVAAQAAPDAEIQETIRHSRETWSRTGLYFEQGRREQEARQTSTKVHRAEKLNITNPKARVPPAAAGLRARA